jgi:hypothetical protein
MASDVNSSAITLWCMYHPGQDHCLGSSSCSGETHPVDGSPVLSDADYQCCPDGEASAHELVVSSHLKVTPVAIAYFR